MKGFGVSSRINVGELVMKMEELQLPIPIPNKHEVCIEVYASSIIINDIQMIEGSMLGGVPISPKPSKKFPAIPGTDFAGIVANIGSRVTKFKVGQKVYGICNPMKKKGPWAEFCLADEKNIDFKPDYLDFVEAASLPLVGSVAVNAIASIGVVKEKICLVIGASGGIGSVCIQTLEGMGAETWAVCSKKNFDMVIELGATKTFDYTQESFAQQIKGLGIKVDAVIDCVGGKEIEKEALSVLNQKGKFITVVGPIKFIGETKLKLFTLLKMFIYIAWRTLSSWFLGQKRYVFTGASSPNFKQINELLVRKKKKVKIDRIVPFQKEEIIAAIKHVLSHRASGKVVIKIKD